MSATPCRVWHLHQARCLLCDWFSEVTGSAAMAAEDARDHRASDEHRAALARRRAGALR